MKVLMQSRLDAFSKRGGDTIQMEKPIPFLEKMGVQTTISNNMNADISKYDLVHLVGITRVHETYSQMQHAVRYGKPVVLTPMYNCKENYELYIKYSSDSIISKLYRICPSFDLYQKIRTMKYCLINRDYQNALKQIIIGYKNQQEYVLKNTTMLIPNSVMELNAIKKELNCTGKSNMIIHSGVEIEKDILKVSPSLFFDKYEIKDFVLIMGRIEPLKNQIKLMEAMDGVDIPVVFSGALTKENHNYCNRFLELVKSRKNFHYLGFIDKNILYSAMKNARVIAIPSWFEIVGFTALEGGLMGTNVVVTERGFGRPYFLNDVWYCNPSNTISIKKTILEAYYSLKDKNIFRERILKKYTWEKSSTVIYNSYIKALEIHNKHIN